MMTKKRENKLTLNAFPRDEQLFLEAILAALPKHSYNLLAANQLTRPAFLHLLYKLIKYKAHILGEDDEAAWQALLNDEMKLLNKM